MSLLGVVVSVALSATPNFTEVSSSDALVHGESPRAWTLEAKLGSYLPGIDNSFTNLDPSLRPYQLYFGGSAMLLGELEVERQLFQRFGSLAVGLSAGYAEKYGHAREEGTGELSVETTNLVVVPLKVLAIYRFDWLAQRFGIPVVPYAKFGGVGIPWWSNKGGSIETSGATSGNGLIFGYQVTGGVALQLDFLDPRLAKDFDTGMGVNHTYLFAEYNLLNAKGNGSKPIDFSSRYWMFGLAFEY